MYHNECLQSSAIAAGEVLKDGHLRFQSRFIGFHGGPVPFQNEQKGASGKPRPGKPLRLIEGGAKERPPVPTQCRV